MEFLDLMPDCVTAGGGARAEKADVDGDKTPTTRNKREGSLYPVLIFTS